MYFLKRKFVIFRDSTGVSEVIVTNMDIDESLEHLQYQNQTKHNTIASKFDGTYFEFHRWSYIMLNQIRFKSFILNKYLASPWVIIDVVLRAH